MKILSVLSLGLLFLAGAASAEPNWAQFQTQVEPGDAAAVVAAGDKLMNSAAGKNFKGRLLLMQVVANGDNPATHTWVPIYNTWEDRDAFVAALQNDPAWPAFQKETARLSDPVSQTINQTVKSWGDINDTDTVWAQHDFDVHDPAAFVKALDAFLASETGKKFPGQLYLSAVVAGGQTPTSHILSVGYASTAEMGNWATKVRTGPDWEAYLKAQDKAATFLGTSLSVQAKAWGNPLPQVVK